MEVLALLSLRWNGRGRFAGSAVEHELISLISRLLAAADAAAHPGLCCTSSSCEG